MNPTSVLERSVEAHGGLDRWSGVERIDVRFSAWGLAFTSKLKAGALRNRSASVAVKPQQVTLHDYPGPGRSAVLDEAGTALMHGNIIESDCVNPRSTILGKRPLTPWNSLDLAYFTGCALWTYLTAPFVCLQERFEVTDAGYVTDRAETLDWVGLRYPSWSQTHSTHQTLFFSRDTGLLRRHDYTAEAFSSFARAANRCDDFTTFDGFTVATSREVTPAGKDKRARRIPKLVSIRLQHVRFITQGER
jgi:hypothetical protein